MPGATRVRTWSAGVLAGLLGLCLGAGAASARSDHPPTAAAKCTPVGKAPAATSPYGFFGPSALIPIDQRLKLSSSLGVRWMRVHSAVPVGQKYGMTQITDIPAFKAAGFDIFLSLADPGLGEAGILPQQQTYANNLRAALAAYHPTMVTIENEEDNFPAHMTAADYLTQLKTGCRVAHQMGVLCTDGGMTSKMLIALTVNWDLERGDQAAAHADANYLRMWYGRAAPPGNAWTPILMYFLYTKGVDRGKAILEGAKAAGADRINLHWYVRPYMGYGDEPSQDATILAHIFAMLHARTGLPVTAGEVGVSSYHIVDDQVTAQEEYGLATHLANDGAWPIIIWNPGTGRFPKDPHALSVVDGGGQPLPSAAGLVQAARQHGALPNCGGG